jgi:hypothetical protein
MLHAATIACGFCSACDRIHERLDQSLAGWHWLAFAVLMLKKVFLDNAHNRL